MKCPICKDRVHVDVAPADGFSQDIRECGGCGCAWTFCNGERIMLRPAAEVIKAQEVDAEVEEHTKYSSYADEFVAEEQRVWFS